MRMNPSTLPTRLSAGRRTPLGFSAAVAALAPAAVLVLVALTLVGCTLRRPVSTETKPDQATLNRDERREEVLGEYQQQRTDAMFQAAVADWRRGDAEKCQDLLQQLLKEKPTHRDAQLLLADLYLSQGNLPAAQVTIDAVLAKRPDDVEALNAKALVLEMLDLPEDAQRTRQRAQQTELRTASAESSRPAAEAADGSPATAPLR